MLWRSKEIARTVRGEIIRSRFGEEWRTRYVSNVRPLPSEDACENTVRHYSEAAAKHLHSSNSTFLHCQHSSFRGAIRYLLAGALKYSPPDKAATAALIN